MMLLRKKARQTTDPDERQRLTDEAAQLERRGLEIGRAGAANAEPADAPPETREPQG